MARQLWVVEYERPVACRSPTPRRRLGQPSLPESVLRLSVHTFVLVLEEIQQVVQNQIVVGLFLEVVDRGVVPLPVRTVTQTVRRLAFVSFETGPKPLDPLRP